MYKFKTYTIKANTYIDLIYIESINNKLLYIYSDSSYRNPTNAKDIILKLYKNIYLTRVTTVNASIDFFIFLMH